MRIAMHLWRREVTMTTISANSCREEYFANLAIYILKDESVLDHL